mmetsp:Transcript_2957/g.12084  ORF Transcript_2957/g.12084 Transcript_2957/m.12084 type:complete len:286 (-) Transcript_2957:4944-5801(-)
MGTASIIQKRLLRLRRQTTRTTPRAQLRSRPRSRDSGALLLAPGAHMDCIQRPWRLPPQALHKPAEKKETAPTRAQGPADAGAGLNRLHAIHDAGRFLPATLTSRLPAWSAWEPEVLAANSRCLCPFPWRASTSLPTPALSAGGELLAFGACLARRGGGLPLRWPLWPMKATRWIGQAGSSTASSRLEHLPAPQQAARGPRLQLKPSGKLQLLTEPALWRPCAARTPTDTCLACAGCLGRPCPARGLRALLGRATARFAQRRACRVQLSQQACRGRRRQGTPRRC